MRTVAGYRSRDRRRRARAARIEALASRLGVADRLRLLGRMPQQNLPEIYAAADLLVHPSLREGWPNVLLESMACGTPVVVTNFDRLAEIVGAPEAGRIVAEATPAGLAEAIRELLAAPPEREATRRYAEGFDWQVTTAGQIELFRQICNLGESAAPAIGRSRPLPANRRGAPVRNRDPDRRPRLYRAIRFFSEATTRSAVFPSHSGGGPWRDHRPPSTVSTASPIIGIGTSRLVPSEIVTGRSVVSRTVRHGMPR